MITVASKRTQKYCNNLEMYLTGGTEKTAIAKTPNRALTFVNTL